MQRSGLAGYLGLVSPPESIAPETDGDADRIREQKKHKAPGDFVADTEAVKDKARAYLKHTTETVGGWGETDPHTTTYDVVAMLGDIGCTEQTALALAIEMSPRKLPAKEVTWLMGQIANSYKGRQNDIGVGAPKSKERDNATGWERFGDPRELREKYGPANDEKPRGTGEQTDEIIKPYKNPRIGFLSINDLRNLPPAIDLVGGLLVDRENVAFVSEPKAGKTFLALEIGLSIAAQIPVLNKYPVKRKGHVVYLSGEGHQGMWKRIKAWGALRGKFTDDQLDALAFHYNKGVPSTEVGVADAKAFIEATKARVEAEGGEVVLVVIDTMARSLGGSDENDAATAAKYLEMTEKLRDGLDCTILTLAHASNKEWSRKQSKGRIDFRGSSGFSGGFDSVWTLEKNDTNKTVELRGKWFKEFDDDDRPPLYFKLVKSELGAVLEPSYPQPQADRKPDGTSERQGRVIGRLFSDNCYGWAKGLSDQELTERLVTARLGAKPTDDVEKERLWQTEANDEYRALLNSHRKVWAKECGAYQCQTGGSKSVWRWFLPEKDDPNREIPY
jgi:KaiC/GvpD/RAD55 family RecA-like ATPase